MNKKFFAVVALSAVAACCLSACQLFQNGQGNEGGTEDKNNYYADLNSKLDINYSAVTLTVENTFDEKNTLVSKYVMNYSGEGVKVNYSVERFSSVSLELPSEYEKTVYTGEAIIKDGEVTITDGAHVNVSADIAEWGFDFKEEYFSNADEAGLYLKADVNNPSGFTGYEISCTDMKVSATFLEFFYEIEITYTAENGNAVKLLYEFAP